MILRFFVHLSLPVVVLIQNFLQLQEKLLFFVAQALQLGLQQYDLVASLAWNAN